ncbi:MAG: hypothetical protein IPJ48_11555 [Propionivibrio sp.]|uniref:Uncharacterized protein n=1 Tax=Candidatus Propionivibrio dominans TaxID=2954373 RepID=A0A9D7FG58_9RHOO|nr:hypothetical protein [Candidatus Propionivibrio dominans]
MTTRFFPRVPQSVASSFLIQITSRNDVQTLVAPANRDAFAGAGTTAIPA